LHSVVWETRIRGTKPKQRRQAIWTALHITYQSLRGSPLYRGLLDNSIVMQRLKNEQCDRLWDMCADILRESWSAWVNANKKDRQLDPNNFFKAERRTTQLTDRLIRKYARRSALAARELTAT